jgi:hypothetical protein
MNNLLRRLIYVITPAAIVLSSVGCSTIITGGRKDVNFRTEPSSAHIRISDEKGTAIYEGQTPTLVTLRTGRPYFRTRHYNVAITKDGYQPATVTLKSTVSGWYAGNLVFGGLVGLLIVDPLTGAMYTLPKEQMISLLPNASSGNTAVDTPSLQFADYSTVPVNLRPHLIRLD